MYHIHVSLSQQVKIKLKFNFINLYFCREDKSGTKIYYIINIYRAFGCETKNFTVASTEVIMPSISLAERPTQNSSDSLPASSFRIMESKPRSEAYEEFTSTFSGQDRIDLTADKTLDMTSSSEKNVEGAVAKCLNNGELFEGIRFIKVESIV